MELHSTHEVSAPAGPSDLSDGVTGSRRKAYLIPLVLFVFLLVFFWPVLSPSSEHRSHIGGDLLAKDYPFRLFVVREILRGRIPLWDEHLFGGWPALANSELALLYPPNALLLPFWSEHGFPYVIFEWWILLHLFFAGLGTALLGRRYGLSVAGALLAGTVMMCSGFLVAHKIHSNIIQTIVWLPWVLLSLERFLSHGRMVSVWLCGGCLICAYFGGHPQMAIYLTLVLLLRLLWEIVVTGAGGRYTAVRRSLLVVFAVLVAALTTMVQWLPTRDLVAQGERSNPTYQSSAEFALPLEELVDTIFPEPTRIPGVHGADEKYVGIEVFYWGIIPTLLALLCYPFVRLRGVAGFFLLAGVMALVLALGDATAAHRWAFDFVPGIAWLRATSRWMVLVTLAVALAAGRGLDAVTRDRIFASARTARVYALLAAAFFFCMLFLFLLVVTQRLFIPGREASEVTPLLQQLAWILLCLLLVAGAFALHALGKLNAVALSAVVLLLTFWDLATVHGSREIEEGAGGFVWDEAVETIRSDPTPGRVKIRFGYEGSERRQYNAQVFGFREVDGESPFRPRRYLAQRPLTRLEDPLRINNRYLDLLCTKYLLTDIPSPREPWQRISEHLWYKSDGSPAVRWYGSYLAVDPTAIPWLLASQSIPYDRIALVGRDRFAPQEWGTRYIPGTPVTVDAPLVVLSVSAKGIRHQAVTLIGGDNYSKNGRGYNIVVVDPETGGVVASDCFDTAADFVPPNIVKEGAPENARMARFLDSVPNGFIVIAAVRQEGTNVLQVNAVKGLQACGSGLDLRKQLELAHAMIGIKGMPPGTALEVVGDTEALLMTDVDGSWLQVPPLPDSPAEVSLECAHLNARAIWDTLRFGEPVSLPPSASYSICDGTALLRIPVVVFSSPKDDDVQPGQESDRAGLIVGASDWSPNRRGYNLTALDPLTGQVLATGSFDIGMDWDASAGVVVPGTPENTRMIRFLEAIPTGAVVAGAVRDEGCNILQPETVAAFRGVGCELDLRKKFRWSHAFVGVKGAAPGSAVEIASSTHVIICSVVRNSSVSQLNTSLPVLNPWRRAGLMAQRTPVWMSRAAKTLSGDRVSEPTAVVRVAECVESATPGFPRALETDLRGGDGCAQWSMLKSSSEELELVGSAGEEGILFMSEPFFPGWRAFLDGEEVEIFPVFRFFRSVRVPAGSHTLRIVYQPPSFFRGAVLSCLGLLVWMGWGLWSLSSREARVAA